MKHFAASLDQTLMMGRSLDAMIDGRDALDEVETQASIVFAQAHLGPLLPMTAEAAIVIALLGPVATCFPTTAALDASATALHAWTMELGSVSEIQASIARAEDTWAAWEEAGIALEEGAVTEADFHLTVAANEAAAAKIEHMVVGLPVEYCDVGFHFDRLVLDVKRESDRDRITLAAIDVDALGIPA